MSEAHLKRRTNSEKKVKIYNIDDVNKRILAKPVFIQPGSEYLGSDGKYRSDDVEIYESKKSEFLDAVQKYRALNKAALLNSRDKLDASSNGILRYDLEGNIDDIFKNPRSLGESNENGLLVRKRTVRKIHEDNAGYLEACCLEPWFKRHLRLGKFIHAARTIILKRRLLKNLEKLKELDEEAVAKIEKGHRKCENVAYAHIFEKFLT